MIYDSKAHKLDECIRNKKLHLFWCNFYWCHGGNIRPQPKGWSMRMKTNQPRLAVGITADDFQFIILMTLPFRYEML